MLDRTPPCRRDDDDVAKDENCLTLGFKWRLFSCSMCWWLGKFPSPMSLLSAQRSWSSFRRDQLKDLKVENTPGYENVGASAVVVGQRGHGSSKENGRWNKSRVLVWYHTHVRHGLGQKHSLYFAGDVYAVSQKPRALPYM